MHQPKLMARLSCQRWAKSRTFALLLQLVVSIMIFQANVAVVDGNVIHDAPANENAGLQNDLPMDGGAEIKRNWQSLQGSWGKRAFAGFLPYNEDELYLAEQLTPILMTNDRLAGQRSAELSLGNSVDPTEMVLSREEMDRIDDILNSKRTWKNMNVAWGKRRNAPGWNKFRGAWGKREPGWNNLKGMWGKRSTNNWQKLHAGWGKRAQSFAESN